jgi:hypothetical protein
MSVSDYCLLIMSVDELGPPATEAGQQPPGTQPGLVSTTGQGTVSTSAQNSVAVSTLRVQGSGSNAITNTTNSVFSSPIMAFQIQFQKTTQQSAEKSSEQENPMKYVWFFAYRLNVPHIYKVYLNLVFLMDCRYCSSLIFHGSAHSASYPPPL